ncbi:alpha/beta hydrolase [Chenggangzhangella methanolivorans]|uniref:alpha/beta hydrolase n=1 Tax=Chenggangzhangella methanolivorans TaxID=1437009 RepID=UPI0021BCFD02|nr:alpha/beta hydrolase [Chenggangzhangella methanolivorans]
MTGFLAACGGRPEGVLTPVTAQTPGASSVDLMAVTTRLATAEPGKLFSGERASKISLTDIRISIPPDQTRQIGDVQWPKKLPPDPSKEFATLAANEVTRDGARAWFKREAKGRKHVLLFIHGFNNTYEDAVYRFAQIVHDSGTDAVPVLFTWPSRGSVFAYQYDRESTNYSRDALEETLQTLAKAPEIQDVSILAHSMGSFLTLESLRQMSIRNGRIAPKISNVILAAPDVDVDVFKQQLGEMGPANARPRFTIFTSTDDRALMVSSRLAGKVPRLGAIDPKAEPYASEFRDANIDAFDLTDVESADKLRHGKFASAAVVKAIGGRLVEGQQIADSDLSLGERVGQLTTGVASSAGAAAGAIVSTPLAIIDPRTRRSYGDQWGTVGGGFDDAASSLRPDIRRRGAARPQAGAAQASTTSSAASRPSNSAATR